MKRVTEYKRGDYKHDLKWDKRFRALAVHFAQWSKDPSTQVGCVIVDKEHRIIGTGFNGFPRGVADTPKRLKDRATKLKIIVHAEVNALHNAVRDVHGCTLYSTFFPCPQCAAQIIQAGITRVVAAVSPSDDRYPEDRKLAMTMLNEAGIDWKYGPL